jgi:hypothetical protein
MSEQAVKSIEFISSFDHTHSQSPQIRVSLIQNTKQQSFFFEKRFCEIRIVLDYAARVADQISALY